MVSYKLDGVNEKAYNLTNNVFNSDYIVTIFHTLSSIILFKVLITI